MDKEKIYESLQPEKLKTWLKSAFSEVGIHSQELLLDDKKIEKAAHIAYKKIPMFPFRAAIKTIIGEKGFVNLVFKIRDKMLESKSMDLSWLTLDNLKSIISSIKN